MSTTGYNSALNITRDRAGLILESELATPMATFEGTSDTDAFVYEDRAGATRGSKFTITFAGINHDEHPKGTGDPTVGSESQGTEYTQDVELRYHKYDGFVENFILEQGLVNFSKKDQEISRLARQWAYNEERGIMNQLTGNTLVNTGWTDYGGSGGNAVVAQDSAHIYYCPDSTGTNASDAEVAADSSSVLDTGVIQDLVLRATSRDYVSWPLVPCDTPFGPLFILAVHGTGYQQLRSSAAGEEVYDLYKAAIQGGSDLSMSPLQTAEGFIYYKTLVLKTNFAPQGITGGAAQSLTRCAAFFGARAGHKIYGEGFTDGDHLGYSEHTIHRRLSMLTDTIRGFNRTIVDGQSWASFRVVHYSAV